MLRSLAPRLHGTQSTRLAFRAAPHDVLLRGSDAALVWERHAAEGGGWLCCRAFTTGLDRGQSSVFVLTPLDIRRERG